MTGLCIGTYRPSGYTRRRGRARGADSSAAICAANCPRWVGVNARSPSDPRRSTASTHLRHPPHADQRVRMRPQHKSSLQVPDLLVIPVLRGREGPLPRSPYRRLRRSPVDAVPRQSVALESVSPQAAQTPSRCPLHPPRVSNLSLGSDDCANDFCTGLPDPRQLPSGRASARIRRVIKEARGAYDLACFLGPPRSYQLRPWMTPRTGPGVTGLSDLLQSGREPAPRTPGADHRQPLGVGELVKHDPLPGGVPWLLAKKIAEGQACHLGGNDAVQARGP